MATTTDENSVPTLSEGRNEFTHNIDGVDFHIIYDRSSTSTTQPKRRLVLLSHALMADHTMYDSTVQALNNAGYDTLRYDHIGHGGDAGTGMKHAEWQGRSWDFDDFTRHMHSIVEMVVGKEDVELEAVVGCSMGGVLVLRYAMLFGQEYARSAGKKLKVVSMGSPGVKVLEGSEERWEERKQVFRKEGVEVLAHRTAERWMPDPVPDGVRERAEVMCRRTTLEGYEKCAEGIVSYDYSSKGELEALKKDDVADTLVIRGEKDSAVGPESISIDVAERVGGKFIGMKVVGHLPPMHDANGFERILLDFLEH